MGCDIHAYIDYDDFTTKEEKTWISCWARDIDLGRSYVIFALMAGVRYDSRTHNFSPLFEPRGITDGQISWTVEHE